MKHPTRKLNAAVLALVLLMAGCGDRSADETLANAKASLAKGDTQSAIVGFKDALQQAPDSGEVRFLLGKALLDAGDAELAYVELRKALDLKFPSVQVVPPLAKALLARQRLQPLIDEFAATDLGEPAANADLMTTLASAYDSLGKANESQAAIDAALKFLPSYPEALLLQARLLAGVGKFDEALALTEGVIGKTPADGEAWFVKGAILIRGKSDAGGAIEAFGKAVALKPNHLLARSNLISLLLAKPDLKAATAHLGELRKRIPKSPQIMFFDAQLALADGKPKLALQLIDQVLKTTSANPLVIELAGVIQLENGLLVQAERSFTRALELAPKLPVARQRLVQTYLNLGQPDKALATLQPLLTGPDASAGAYALAGEAHFRTRDLDLSRTHFANAVKLDPTNPMTRTSLALVSLKSAGIDATVKELRAIAATDKGTTADMALVPLLARQKDFDGALTAVDAIDKKLPKSAIAANLRGQVHLLKSDMAAARSSYERALEIDPLFIPSASMLATLDLVDKKPEAARKRFEKILAADSSNYQATLEMAKMLAVAQAPKADIARVLADAIKLRPTEEEPRLRLIELYLAQKQGKSALAAASEAVAALPDSTMLLDAFGRALVANGDINQAVNTFGKLAVLKPNSPEPHLHLAAAYLVGKNSSAAEKSLRQALSISPELLTAQQSLIRLMLNGKRHDEAVAIARTVQKQRPSSDAGYMMESAIEVSRKNVPASLDVYRRALSKQPRTTIAIRLHEALIAANDKAGADKMVEKWIAEHPKDAEFRFHLGDLAMAREDYEIAQKYFRNVIALQPENVAALNNIAWAMAKLKQPGAIRFAEQAVKLKPDTPGLMDTLAMTLAADKQFDKAVDVQKRVLALAAPPTDQVFRLNLARIYLQAGNTAAARTELQTLEKLGATFRNHLEVSRLLKTL